jgi:hypothetical protein
LDEVPVGTVPLSSLKSIVDERAELFICQVSVRIVHRLQLRFSKTVGGARKFPSGAKEIS